MVSFKDAVKLYFANYINFTGRATRAEFWWTRLLLVIVLIPLFVLISEDFIALIFLAIIIPELALVTRRIRDVCKSPYWIWIVFPPIAQIAISFISGLTGTEYTDENFILLLLGISAGICNIIFIVIAFLPSRK